MNDNNMVDSSISLKYSSGAITALLFLHHKKVIAGCGNQLLVFSLENFKLEARKEILEGASIHGICKGPLRGTCQQLMCVYGAKETCIVSVKNVENSGCEINILTKVFRVYDWIWEARWLKEKDEREPIALALAHNSVALWDWECGKISTIQHCVENCILYCAHFIGETWDDLVLAAGTVFNQVVIWSVDGSKKKDDNEAMPVIHTLTGHKGVIFSIKYHPGHKRLCSVSDDRSIQIWQLSFPDSSASTSPSTDDWKSVQSVLLLTLFGHTARVWDAVLMNECFASIGEDATCFVWNYDGKIMSKFKGHKGRSIWSIAASEDESVLVTGGGDSSVRMWKIQAESSWSSLQHTIDIPKDITPVDGDFPRFVTLLSFDVILVMMNSGCFSSYQLSSQTWRCLFNDARFGSYSVISPCPYKSKVAVGSITGSLKVLCLSGDLSTDIPQVDQSMFGGKIMGIAWVSEKMLLVTGPEGQCILLTVTEEEDSSGVSLNVASNLVLFLPPSIHRWFTAACSIQLQSKQMIICGDKNGSIHCYLYSHFDSSTMLDQDPLLPSQTFQRVHGKTGVTSVQVKDGLVYSTGRDGCYRQWETKGDILSLRHSVKVTKGFDWLDKLEWRNDDMLVYGFLSSFFVVWSVSGNQQIVSVQCGGGHRSWGCCHDNGALRFTFLKAGKIFMVDSKQCNEQSLIKPPLHGRELCDGKIIRCVETRDESPAFIICTTSEDTTINVGMLSGRNELTKWSSLLTLKGHLSSVRCVAICHSWQEELSGIQRNSGQPETLMNPLQNNLQSGQCFLFTGGGRAEIRVWKLCFSERKKRMCETSTTNIASGSSEEVYAENLNSKTGVSKEAGLNDSDDNRNSKEEENAMVNCTYEELSTHFLGESRHKTRYSNWKAQKLQLDPETRVMSLAASPLTDVLAHLKSLKNFPHDDEQARLKCVQILSVAGSDGILRVFSYNSNTRLLTSVVQSSIHKGCVLKVMHFVNKMENGDPAIYLFSTSTNGCIILWSLKDIAQRILKTFEDKKAEKMGEISKGDLASNNEVSEAVSGSSDESDDDGDYIDFNTTSEKPESKAEDWQPLCQLKAHQSGVNSISVCHFNSNTILLASGGDDNALTLQMIELNNDNINVVSKVTKTDAHAAQVTGVWVVSPTVVVSVSIDQRICVWSVNIDGPNGDMQLSMIKCKYIHIADVSNMDVYLHGDAIYILISGEGLCLYSFK